MAVLNNASHKAASRWSTLDFDADEQMALLLTEHRERCPRPGDPARYSEGPRLQWLTDQPFGVTALLYWWPRNRDYHKTQDTQLLNCLCPLTASNPEVVTVFPVLPQNHPVQTHFPVKRPLPTLPHCRTPVHSGVCSRWLQQVEKPGVLTLGSYCQLLTANANDLNDHTSESHGEVLPWLV